jgi:cell division GTPase FtsZ
MFSKGFVRKDITCVKRNNSYIYTSKSPIKSNFKVIGIGTEGIHIIKEIYNSNFKKAELISIHTDNNVWWQRYHKAICIGLDNCKGLPLIKNKKKLKIALKKSENEIIKIIKNSKIVYIIASMDETISGIGSVTLANYAKKNNVFVVGHAIMPFNKDKDLKLKSTMFLNKFRKSCDVIDIFDPNNLLPFYNNSEKNMKYEDFKNIMLKFVKLNINTWNNIFFKK